MTQEQKRGLADFVRTPHYELRSLDELISDEHRPTDHRFVELYRRFLSGKLIGLYTRVDILNIVPGHLHEEPSGTYTQVNQDCDDKHIEWATSYIRQGHRPSLCLYPAFIGPAKSKLICSDDVIFYHGYINAGIRTVPAFILGRHKEKLTESAICVRGKHADTSIVFDSTIPKPRSTAASVLGDGEQLKALQPVESLLSLRELAQHTSTSVKTFHTGSEQGAIHYHHTLHSVVYRLIEIIDAVVLLIQNDLAHHIRPLIRSAYDLFLNFYLDWLCPEKVGPLLQCLAVLSRENKSESDSQQLEAAIKRNYGSFADICTKQKEKGRLSPFGEALHQMVYSSLSPAVHQDFGIAHEYGFTLEEGKPTPLSHNELMMCVRWLDIIVCATAIRILDDTGGEFPE